MPRNEHNIDIAIWINRCPSIDICYMVVVCRIDIDLVSRIGMRNSIDNMLICDLDIDTAGANLVEILKLDIGA